MSAYIRASWLYFTWKYMSARKPAAHNPADAEKRARPIA